MKMRRNAESLGAVHTHTHTHTHTSDLENKNKERNSKVIRKETVITAVVILVVIIIASSVCAGLAFARNEKAKVQESGNDGKVMQSTQVAEAEPASQGEQGGAQTETIIQTTQSAQTDAATQSEQGTQASELVDNENMTVQTDAEGKKVPVPRGYVGSQAAGENEISKGYVIYEGEEPVTDTNVADAQKTRNQYVWVPVPDVSKMYGTDSSGKKWGKLYYFATSSSNANYDATTGAYPNNWSETNGVIRILDSTGYREPDVLTYQNYDSNSYLKQYGLGSMTKHDLLLEMQKDFNNMINSVKKYGGFYIGRYETGDLNQEFAVVRKGNTNIASQTWYTMYKKCKKLKGANKQVETGMIFGSQWDRTLMWLVESGNKSIAEICNDSTSWGNYRNATFTYTNTSGGTSTKSNGSQTRIPTGSADYTKANNIYDLAGNVYDWTLEACDTYLRVCRGVNFVNDGGYPANDRSYYVPYNSVNVSRC